MASHTFSWEGDGVDVTLLGSFDSWKSPGRTMDRVENGFAVTISLPPGRYEYKFIVDGEYRYDPHKKVVPDGQGGLNNVYETTETPSGNTINVKMASHDNQQSSDSLTQEQPIATTTANKASYTVKITRIAKTVTEATLTKLVEKHGTLVSKVAIKGTTNRYAWVNFDSLEGAKKAVKNLNGYCQEGLKLNASLKQSSNVPAVKPLPRQAPASKVSPIKHNTKNAEFTQKLPYQLDLIRSKDNKDTESIGCDDPISEVNVQLQCLSVDDLVLRINYELKNTKAATREQIMQLEWELNEITIPKKCPLELFQTLQARRTSIEHEIAESESRQIVFSTFCEKLLAMATTGSPLSALQLERSFICECSRYHKGLPIYSHRLQIMKMIKENQVSILTAETGSGKSTQLVQYISEDGFADTGIIVCTQPRKVAAMSLAKYVSSEMLAVPGSIVGYKTGIRGNYSDQTKVLYVTDHTLLNECVEDPNFSKYSCLIVDEAHERNLNTDVLLAFIKRCLPKRPELRVVITSATIDPESFIRYFGLDCPVKKVPGRAFPVDVTYCPIDDNPSVPSRRFMPEYVTGAIKLASTLHSNEPPGDILVFLTSPAEVEQACQSLEMLTNDTAHVLPLHGKLQPDDQQKVFREYSLRKIVFSTNVAETSVTIPGVKYIVDSGLAKELCFDAKKNMNSLEVRPISKSSAEQRKGRAGRTSAGKCYRLYSEDTYKNMAERMVPEILRVSLAGTVLKLHELGIRDVLNFDFIEKPEEVALKYAVKTLTFLGAVIDGRLTNMGKSMAALPVDPRLSRIILDGLDERAGPEAIAMAAISSLAGTIFFRGGTDEMKEQSDLLKSTFCVPEGDQLTDLNAYCQWVNQSPQDRTAWCVEKSINAKSMRIVHESVRDLTEILTKQLKLPIHSTSLSLEVASERVTRLFFKAFANNLCAFLGHKNIGYFNPNLPDEKLVIFPGSALNKLNSQPQLLVYEKTLKTSQHFLLQTLPVKEEWVKEALKNRVIPYHPMACEQYKKLAVTSFTIGNLGEYVLNILKRNQRMIIDQMSTNMLKKI